MANPFESSAGFNPIVWVDGVHLPVSPSSCTWEQEDLSNAEAGRTEDGAMHKNRIGTITRIGLEFQNLPLETMYEIINIFSPEYIWVTYIDPATRVTSQWDTSYEKNEWFYVGNRNMIIHNARLNICEKLSFNIISRYPR